jgi:formylglycine-generating enzyme required for sulfatase activity
VAYAAHKGKKYWVLLDGKKGPEFEGEKSLCLAFSPDSSHLAYVAQRGGKESVVLDGQNGPEFDSIGLRAGSAFEPSLVFSADSRRLAYIAKRGESLAVVVDGQAGPEFDEILEATPLFSNDSTHMAYAGRKGHKAVVVLDGQAGPKFDSIQLHSVCFSDDSKHFAYATDRAGKSLIMLDGMAGPEFDRVFLSGPLSFDAGGAVQYLAAKAGTLYRVRQELRPEAPGQATSKPTSSAANSPSEPASLPPGKKPRIYEEWPFDAKQAAARQQETADQLGVPRDLNVDCGRGVKMRLVLIPAGRFMIGSPDDEKGREMNEGPLHEVTLTRPFYMAVTEVTQAQYFAVTGLDPSGIKDPNNPVEMLEWRDADMFCQLLSPKTGRNVHLPTEAQWEYACRAGSSAAFSFGDNWEDYDSYLWCMFNSKVPNNSMGEPHLALAGQKKPNASGLFDMHGNVAEWCADWYSDSYAQARVTDPTGPAAGEDHVRRGGSYFVDPGSCRSATRGQGGMLNDSGFRIVVDLP